MKALKGVIPVSVRRVTQGKNAQIITLGMFFLIQRGLQFIEFFESLARGQIIHIYLLK